MHLLQEVVGQGWVLLDGRFCIGCHCSRRCYSPVTRTVGGWVSKVAVDVAQK